MRVLSLTFILTDDMVTFTGLFWELVWRTAGRIGEFCGVFFCLVGCFHFFNSLKKPQQTIFGHTVPYLYHSFRVAGFVKDKQYSWFVSGIYAALPLVAALYGLINKFNGGLKVVGYKQKNFQSSPFDGQSQNQPFWAPRQKLRHRLSPLLAC